MFYTVNPKSKAEMLNGSKKVILHIYQVSGASGYLISFYNPFK